MLKENKKEIENAEKINEKVIEINEKINLRIGIKEAATKRFKKTLKDFNEEFGSDLSEEEIETKLNKLVAELTLKTNALEEKIEEIEELYSNEDVDLEETIMENEETIIKETKEEKMNIDKVTFEVKEEEQNIKVQNKIITEEENNSDEGFGGDFGDDFNDIPKSDEENKTVSDFANVLDNSFNIE